MAYLWSKAKNNRQPSN